MFTNEKLKQIKSQVKECVLPRVLVLSTEEVNNYIKSRTGMSAAHFLQYHNKLEVVTKEATNDSLKVRFVDPNDVSGRITDNGAYYIGATGAGQHSEDYAGFSLCTADDLPPFFKAYPDPTPWFGDWLEVFLKCVAPSNQSTINHPVACLLLVSTGTDGLGPAAQANIIWGKEPPAFFRERPFLSTSIPVFYTPVRTAAAAPDVSRAMAELQGAFGGKNCYPLKLSALDPTAAPAPSGPGTGCDGGAPVAAAAAGGDASSGLSHQKGRLGRGDAAEFENFMKTFLSSSVIPYLHTTVNTLHAFIQQNRKGFGSRVKSFFRFSDDSSNGSNTNNNSSSSSSSSSSNGSGGPNTPGGVLPPEQMAYTPARHLADVQFLIGDYEHSVKGHQQLVSGDLRGEPLAAAYAQALIGLGHFFTEGKAPDANLQAAVAAFCERGDGGRRFSILTMVLRGLVALYRESGPRAAGHFRAASERVGDSFSAGVLCEQAAFCCLRPAQRPLLRKFTFLLLNSGQHYANAGLTQHAFRCFRLGAGIYAGAGWRKIDDYINLALVAHSFACGTPDAAEPYIARLVEHNERSFDAHSTVLRYLLLLHKRRASLLKLDSAALLPQLPLPIVVTASSSAADAVSRPTFALSVNDDPPACAEGCPFAGLRWPFLGADNRVVFSGEQAHVDVTVTNPFAIPLLLGQVHAVCEFKPHINSSSSSSNDNISESGSEEEEGTEEGEPDVKELRKGTYFRSELYDVMLAPNESKTLKLAINTLKEGILRITGFAYKLCKEVWGIHRFSFVPISACSPNNNSNSSGGKNRVLMPVSASASGMSLSSSSLSCQSPAVVQTVPRRIGGGHGVGCRGPKEPNIIVVEPEMPYITLKFEGLPEVVFNGELCRVNLVLTNNSLSAAAADVRVAFSHPAFFALDTCPQEGEESGSSSSSGSGGGDISAKIDRPVTPSRTPRLFMAQDDVGLLTWMSFGFTIAPSSSVVLPFWFRPYGFSVETAQTLHTAVSYKAATDVVAASTTTATSSQWTRYGHLHTKVVVKPVIHFDIQMLENYRDVEAFNVKMTVRNLHPERPLQLRQLSCLSRRCAVEPLFPQASDGLLGEGEGFNLFLKLRIVSPAWPERKTSIVPLSNTDCDSENGPALDPAVAPCSTLVAQENREHWERKQRALEALNEAKSPFGAANLPSFNTAHRRVKEQQQQGEGGCEGGEAEGEDMSSVTLVWETEGVTGFSNMFIPPHTFPKNRLLDPAPVAIALDSPAHVEHSFAEKAVCTVPVKVRVRNFSADTPVKVTLFPLLPDSSFGGLVWAGLTSFGLDNALEPLESKEIVLTLCLTAPGVFNVSDAIKVIITDRQSLTVYKTLPSLSFLNHIVEVKEPPSQSV